MVRTIRIFREQLLFDSVSSIYSYITTPKRLNPFILRASLFIQHIFLSWHVYRVKLGLRVQVIRSQIWRWNPQTCSANKKPAARPLASASAPAATPMGSILMMTTICFQVSETHNLFLYISVHLSLLLLLFLIIDEDNSRWIGFSFVNNSMMMPLFFYSLHRCPCGASYRESKQLDYIWSQTCSNIHSWYSRHADQVYGAGERHSEVFCHYLHSGVIRFHEGYLLCIQNLFLCFKDTLFIILTCEIAPVETIANIVWGF